MRVAEIKCDEAIIEHREDGWSAEEARHQQTLRARRQRNRPALSEQGLANFESSLTRDGLRASRIFLPSTGDARDRKFPFATGRDDSSQAHWGSRSHGCHHGLLMGID